MSIDNKFEWTDELVKEFLRTYSLGETQLRNMEKFKQSKSTPESKSPEPKGKRIDMDFLRVAHDAIERSGGDKTLDELLNFVLAEPTPLQPSTDTPVPKFKIGDVVTKVNGTVKMTVEGYGYRHENAFMQYPPNKAVQVVYFRPNKQVRRKTINEDKLMLAPDTPVKERIEVTNITQWNMTDILNGGRYLKVDISDYPKHWQDKIPQLKQAVEAALNEDTVVDKQIPHNLEAEFYKVVKENESLALIIDQLNQQIIQLKFCSPQKTDTVIQDKPVLFTTEDGVDIGQGYKGDLWRVFTSGTSYETWKPYNFGMPQYKNPSEKYFSKLEAAEQYIDLNKPKLSLQMVLHKINGFIPDEYWYIIKEKLKQ